VRGRERLTSLRTLLSQLFRKYLKALVDLYKREDSPESGLVFYLWIQLGVNMQGRDQDNGELTLSDDLSESIIGDFDEAALDDIEKNTPTLSDAARLAQKRRRAEDLLERRRLREELGDDDFSFD
jgi:hypothetical protein